MKTQNKQFKQFNSYNCTCRICREYSSKEPTTTKPTTTKPTTTKPTTTKPTRSSLSCTRAFRPGECCLRETCKGCEYWITPAEEKPAKEREMSVADLTQAVKALKALHSNAAATLEEVNSKAEKLEKQIERKIDSLVQAKVALQGEFDNASEELERNREQLEELVNMPFFDEISRGCS